MARILSSRSPLSLSRHCSDRCCCCSERDGDLLEKVVTAGGSSSPDRMARLPLLSVWDLGTAGGGRPPLAPLEDDICRLWDEGGSDRLSKEASAVVSAALRSHSRSVSVASAAAAAAAAAGAAAGCSAFHIFCNRSIISLFDFFLSPYTDTILASSCTVISS